MSFSGPLGSWIVVYIRQTSSAHALGGIGEVACFISIDE